MSLASSLFGFSSNLAMLSSLAVSMISYRYFFEVKKVTKKPFVRINLLVRASTPPLYATLLLAAARFTARLLADAPSRKQNSYGLVWLRHSTYGGRVVLLMDVVCRWLVTGEEVTGNR